LTVHLVTSKWVLLPGNHGFVNRYKRKASWLRYYYGNYLKCRHLYICAKTIQIHCSTYINWQLSISMKCDNLFNLKLLKAGRELNTRVAHVQLRYGFKLHNQLKCLMLVYDHARHASRCNARAYLLVMINKESFRYRKSFFKIWLIHPWSDRYGKPFLFYNFGLDIFWFWFSLIF